MPESTEQSNGTAGAGAENQNGGSAGAGAAPSLEQLQAQVTDLNKKLADVTKESIDRRHKLKEAEETLGQVRKLFGASDNAETKDKAITAEQRQAEKAKAMLFRSEAVSAAARLGARNPSLVARMLDSTGVEVNLDADTVDSAALSEKLAKLKESEPYLFGGEPKKDGGDGEGTKGKGGSSDDPGTKPPDQGKELVEWRRMVKSGDKAGAQQYYLKNKATIDKQLSGRR